MPIGDKKKTADSTLWGTQACPRKEGVRNSRCLCDAGKVEPHGSFTVHSTILVANPSLFPFEIPAEICPSGKTSRKFAPTWRKKSAPARRAKPEISVRSRGRIGLHLVTRQGCGPAVPALWQVASVCSKRTAGFPAIYSTTTASDRPRLSAADAYISLHAVLRRVPLVWNIWALWREAPNKSENPAKNVWK